MGKVSRRSSGPASTNNLITKITASHGHIFLKMALTLASQVNLFPKLMESLGFAKSFQWLKPNN